MRSSLLRLIRPALLGAMLLPGLFAPALSQGSNARGAQGPTYATPIPGTTHSYALRNPDGSRAGTMVRGLDGGWRFYDRDGRPMAPLRTR